MLYLLPNFLSAASSVFCSFPPAIEPIVASLDGVFAESEKSARRFLSQFTLKMPLQQFPLVLLNEHTSASEIKTMLHPVVEGQHWAILPDAGLPCIADPGAALVAQAHRLNIPVETVVGPSSIIMALQLSGSSGQCFTFHGYLPRDKNERRCALLQIAANRSVPTHIFIETPYRNQQLLHDVLAYLPQNAHLTVAAHLMSSERFLYSATLVQWRQSPLIDAVPKAPAVFVVALKGCS